MVVVTPIKTGQSLSKDVLQSLIDQDIEFELIVNSHDADMLWIEREVNININRMYLQQAVMERKFAYDEIILLLDSDVIIPTGLVKQLINKLNSSNYVCVAAKLRGDTDHVVTECAVIRYEHYITIPFTDDLRVCQCKKLLKVGPISYL